MDHSCLSLEFPAVGGREVAVHFNGGELTSDAGLMILQHADRQLGLLDALAGGVKHGVRGLLAERVFPIAAGYEDASDLDRLRADPALNRDIRHP